MTFQEILKAKNLSDEDIKAVIGEMKQNKIFTAGEENMDIRYGKLKTDFDALNKQHGESTALIEQMKKENTGNADLQGKITEYETKMQQLQTELNQTKVDAALKVALLKAKVVDADYMAFKVKEQGNVKIDAEGNVKGIEDTLTALKTQYPTQFASESKKIIYEKKLPESNHEDTGLTKADVLKKPYAERIKFFEENPDAYKQIMHPDQQN